MLVGWTILLINGSGVGWYQPSVFVRTHVTMFLHLSSPARIEVTQTLGTRHHDGFSAWFQNGSYGSTCFNYLDSFFGHFYPYRKILDMWSQLTDYYSSKTAGNMLKHICHWLPLILIVYQPWYVFYFLFGWPWVPSSSHRPSPSTSEVASLQTARSAWPSRRPIRTRSTMTWCRRRHTFHGEDWRRGGTCTGQHQEFLLYLRGWELQREDVHGYWLK